MCAVRAVCVCVSVVCAVSGCVAAFTQAAMPLDEYCHVTARFYVLSHGCPISSESSLRVPHVPTASDGIVVWILQHFSSATPTLVTTTAYPPVCTRAWYLRLSVEEWHVRVCTMLKFANSNFQNFALQTQGPHCNARCGLRVA